MPIGLADRIAGYVNEAHKSVPRRGAEAGGLLLGGVRLGPVIDIFITGFEPIPCDYLFGPSFVVSDAVQAEFRSAMARYPAAEILGYYRSHTRKGTGLEASDQEIVDRVFPGLSGLVLLVKPSGAGSFAASYFFFQTGRLETRPVGPEFPFLTSVPGGTPPPSEAEPEEPPVTRAETPSFKQLVQESLQLADEAPSPREAEPVRPEAKPATLAEHPEVSKRRVKLQWEIVASGLMIAAALGLLWWQYHGVNGEDGVPAAQAGPSHVASLGLAVHPGEGGWRITWDPASVTARESIRGALDITDDEAHESIPLSAAQIQAGSATYRPTGDDITFRLDMFARDSSMASESYRVLMRPKERAAATVAPVPPKVAPQPEKPSAMAEKLAAAKPVPKDETTAAAATVEPEVLERVAPEVGAGIRPRITSPISIDVKVTIDREGRVARATAIQHQDGLIDYLGTRAVAAARKWTFTPGKRGGKPVESTRTIHFVFEQ